MISLTQIGFPVYIRPIFSQNFIKNKYRKSILNKFPNQKRKFNFFSNNILFKISQKTYSENFKIYLKHQTRIFLPLLRCLFIIYVLVFSLNYLEILYTSIEFQKNAIFSLLNHMTLLILLKLFFSNKNFEEEFLKKVLTSFIYLKFVWITEYCNYFSGNKNIWILFKLFNYLAIIWNLWIGKNDISVFPLSNKKENKVFWKVKTFFLAIFSLDIFLEMISRKDLSLPERNFSNFSFYLLNWIVFLKEKTFNFTSTDLWFFSTLSFSFLVFIHLSLLYLIAFSKISGNFKSSSLSMKQFLLDRFLIKNNKLKQDSTYPSTTSYLNSFNKLSSNNIEELLTSEKINLISDQKEKNNRWKIKKKGIKTPFSESAWNGELPLLKQSLWYEIKSK
jgi:hypothetical protein